MALGLAFLIVAAGCNRKQPPAAASQPSAEEQMATQQRLLNELQETMRSAETAFSGGQTNAAIARVEAAQADPRFAACRPQIFDFLLRLLLRADPEAARARVAVVCGDSILAEPGCRLFHDFLAGRGSRETMAEAAAWDIEMLDRTNLLAALKPTFYIWGIHDHVALAEDARAIELLRRALQALPPEQQIGCVEELVNGALAASRLETVDQVLAMQALAQPLLRDFATLARFRVNMARNEWPTVTNEFASVAGTLSDGSLNRLLQTILAAAKGAQRSDAVDACAQTVLFTGAIGSNAPSAVATAARTWLDASLAGPNKDPFPLRLASLVGTAVSPDLLAGYYLSNFYALSDKQAAMQSLLSTGERLLPLTRNEDTRDEIKTKLLEGCFLLHDYDGALRRLEAGIPNRDAQWHKTAIIKLKAHRALARNEPREAVKYFRDFMACSKELKAEDLSDPVTGIMYPREMILGRNAKRIGDILAAIPDAAEGAKAYQEAREYYRQALGQTDDKDARKVIETELAQLPK